MEKHWSGNSVQSGEQHAEPDDRVDRAEASTSTQLSPQTQLLPHQQDGINACIQKIEAHGGVILGDSMGLGKSLQAMNIMMHFKLKGILCIPKTLTAQWKAEASKFGMNFVFKEFVGYGNKRRAPLIAEFRNLPTNASPDVHVLIISPDILRASYAEFEETGAGVLVIDEVELQLR